MTIERKPVFFVDPIIRMAFDLAMQFHNGQVRKHSGAAYVSHVIDVADRVNRLPYHNPTMVCIALLHDAIEEAPEDRRESIVDTIRAKLGPVVLEGVLGLTNKKNPALSREEQKKLDRERLATASRTIRAIKLCDRIANVKSLSVFPVSETPFIATYLAESRSLLAALSDTDLELQRELMSAIEDQEVRIGIRKVAARAPAYPSVLHWQLASEQPPHRVPILMTGSSGYVEPNHRFVEAGFYDAQWRPLAPWRNCQGDAVNDSGNYPTHWCLLSDLELPLE